MLGDDTKVYVQCELIAASAVVVERKTSNKASYSAMRSVGEAIGDDWSRSSVIHTPGN